MPKPLIEFLPLVQGVRGLSAAPPELVLEHVREKAIEFAERTRVWKFPIVLSVQANVCDYPVELPAGAALVGLVSASPNGRCSCDRVYIDDNAILHIPAPVMDEEDAYDIVVACRPAMSACELPESLYDRWAYAIADGAASAMYAMPKPATWFNSALSTYYRRLFERAVGMAKNQTTLGYTPRKLFMTGARF